MGDSLVREGVDLGKLAQRQRFLLWCVLASLVMNCVLPLGLADLMARLGPLVAIAFLLAIIVVSILILITVLRLMSTLRWNIVARIICGVLMFLPVVSFVILLVVDNRTNAVFKRAGIRVGLMGVADETVRRRLLENLCRECGYNLTGNVSGICSECGTPIMFVDA